KALERASSPVVVGGTSVGRGAIDRLQGGDHLVEVEGGDDEHARIADPGLSTRPRLRERIRSLPRHRRHDRNLLHQAISQPLTMSIVYEAEVLPFSERPMY